MRRKVLYLCLSLMFLGLPLAHAQEVGASFKYNENGKRDPFWKLVDENGDIISFDHNLRVSDLRLEGIMAEGYGKYVAIVNGEIVKVNDSLGAYVIQKIDSSGVTLAKGDEIFIIKLKKEE